MSENYLTIKDYSIEFGTNLVSAAIQLVPIVGSSLNQMTFGYMNSLQVTRIENYLVELSNYLQAGTIQKEILDQVSEYLSSDEGREFFYINLEKVTKTRNKEKLDLYRNMLLNQSNEYRKFSLDTAEEFLNIMDNLKFESVQVLDFLSNYKETEQKNRNVIDAGSITKEVNDNKESEYMLKLKVQYLYSIDELNYFHQQLITNGLAVDDSMGFFGGKPLEKFKITKMGKLFLDYVKEIKS